METGFDTVSVKTNALQIKTNTYVLMQRYKSSSLGAAAVSIELSNL